MIDEKIHHVTKLMKDKKKNMCVFLSSPNSFYSTILFLNLSTKDSLMFLGGRERQWHKMGQMGERQQNSHIYAWYIQAYSLANTVSSTGGSCVQN